MKTPRLKQFFFDEGGDSVWQVKLCPNFKSCKLEQKRAPEFGVRCLHLCKGKEIRRKDKIDDKTINRACVGSAFFEALQNNKISKTEALLKCL
jgi:hypothetical protein